MRLWHYELIPYLPKSQLLAQWRELNSIFKNQPKHILINYVYEYPKEDLCLYANIVTNEMFERGYKFDKENYKKYFKDEPFICENFHAPFLNDHNDRYLLQCFFNLQEKHDRGQKDFTIAQMDELVNFMRKRGFGLEVIDR